MHKNLDLFHQKHVRVLIQNSKKQEFLLVSVQAGIEINLRRRREGLIQGLGFQ